MDASLVPIVAPHERWRVAILPPWKNGHGARFRRGYILGNYIIQASLTCMPVTSFPLVYEALVSGPFDPSPDHADVSYQAGRACEWSVSTRVLGTNARWMSSLLMRHIQKRKRGKYDNELQD